MGITKNLFYTAIVSFFVFVSCNREQTSQHTNTITIDASGDFSEDYIIKKGSTAKIIPLETNEKALPSSIMKILYYNDKFYIRDVYGKTVYVFNNQGKFVNKLNGQGKGPGEYIFIADFSIEDNKLYILNNGHDIMAYNPDNFSFENLVFKSKDNQISHMYLENGYIYAYNAGSDKIGSMLISIYDPAKENKKDLLRKRIGNTSASEGGVWIDSNEDFTKIIGGKGALFNLSNDNIIYLLANNNVTPLYEINFGKYNMPSSVLNQYDKISEYRSNNKVRKIFRQYLANNVLSILFEDCDYPKDIARQGYLVYNIKRKVTRMYESIHLEALNQDIDLFGNYPGGFIGIIKSYKIVNHLDEINMALKKGEALSPEDEYFKDNFTEYSNPVLVLFNFDDQ